MNLVKNIISGKRTGPVTIDPEASVIMALRLMAEKNIGSVIVMKNDTYLGIFTERDYSRKVVLEGRNSSVTKVSEIMSLGLPEVHAYDTLEKCMELMNDRNIRYLPVMDNGYLTGIISISDVIRQLILVQQETIQHLENYINQ